MKTKLTLSIEQQLIKQAKEHAKRRGTSVSDLVARYFKLLDASEASEEESATKRKHSAFTESQSGILAGSDISEKDYYRYLEEKHK